MDAKEYTIPEVIRAACERQGIGPTDLARRCGVTYRMLWRWRDGIKPTRFKAVVELCRLAGVSIKKVDW